VARQKKLRPWQQATRQFLTLVLAASTFLLVMVATISWVSDWLAS